MLAGCNGPCQRPLAEAETSRDLALPATWEDLVASDRCVQTTNDGDARLVRLGQCETAAGARYDAQGQLDGAYQTDDTGRCTINYGRPAFQVGSGTISPGCVSRFPGPYADTRITQLTARQRTDRTDCHGVRTCVVDGTSYTAELTPDPHCGVPTLDVFDATGQLVASGDYLAWSGPLALAACGAEAFEPSEACGWAQ